MNYSQKTDRELIALLTKNEELAFREIYYRYKDRLWHYCFSFIKSEEESDDMVQEVFIRLWELRKFIDPELSFSSFLYTMARNRVLNFFRDINVEVQVMKVLAQRQDLISGSVESELIFSDYQKILTDAIDKLPPRRKRIFNMSRVENLSHKEIASRLGISVYTVQEHISESLRFIKDYFGKHAGIILSVWALAFLY